MTNTVSTSRTVSPVELAELIRLGQARDLIDVRTPVEFDAVHVSGARLVPLNTLDAKSVCAARSGSSDVPLYILCKSDRRAEKARGMFRAAGIENVVVVAGGTDACIAAGLPIERGSSGVISRERQVRIAAGGIVLTGILLAVFIHPWWIVLSGFVGAGLIFAGITNICGMCILLGRMPWNRRSSCSSGGCCSKS